MIEPATSRRRPATRRIGTAVAIGLGVLLAVGVPTAGAADRLIVGFTGDQSPKEQAATLDAAGASVTTAQVAARDIPAIDVATVSVPSGDADAVAAKLRASDDVAYVEPDRIAHAAADANDPLLVQQWGLPQIGAFTAWNTTVGAGVKIAVVDTGVDATHPDLAGRVEAGWDFVSGDADPSDGQGHGTHVAGIAAGTANNGQGGAGVAPGATILSVRVLDADGSGYYSWIAQGITYAADHGAKVINLSLGGTEPSQAMQNAIEYAAAKGVFLSCASGNDGHPTVSWPAVLDSCFSVGATTQADTRASFSNYGTGLDLVAPGEGILSSVPGGGYESWNGTSMASPFVAGAAALLVAQGVRPSQVGNLLERTAHDVDAPGYDTNTGYGRLDIAAAVATAAAQPAGPADTVAPTVGTITLGAPHAKTRSATTKTAWKSVGTTKWRRVGASQFSGSYQWQTLKRAGSTRRIFQFRIRKGALLRRRVTQKLVSQATATTSTVRDITVAATDDQGVARAGVAIDGNWIGTDSTPADGFTFSWTCAKGHHSIVAYAFDAADNEATGKLEQDVTC